MVVMVGGIWWLMGEWRKVVGAGRWWTWRVDKVGGGQ